MAALSTIPDVTGRTLCNDTSNAMANRSNVFATFITINTFPLHKSITKDEANTCFGALERLRTFSTVIPTSTAHEKSLALTV
jgi:hypothetical protein